tara:strand:- start:7 stop:192 length:186 start_codon:yes stop_codon:yes gene_type:complete
MPNIEMSQAQYDKFLATERKDARNNQRRYAKGRATAEVIAANRQVYDQLYYDYLNDGSYDG